MAKKSNGEGSIRQRSDGRWEARILIKDASKSIYGKTRDEVRKKLSKIINEFNDGSYVPDSHTTVKQWAEIWQRDCFDSIKHTTQVRYAKDLRLYIVPAIGKKKLAELQPAIIRSFYAALIHHGLSEKTIHNIHGTLHVLIQQAVNDELIRSNVCDRVKPPNLNMPKKEMHPLKDEQIPIFLREIQGNKFESLYYVSLFTGMRKAEVIGLTWDCIDFKKGTIHLYRQLRKEEMKNGKYVFTTLKNKQDRTFKPPADVLDVLRHIKIVQAKQRLKCGVLWHDSNLVFTNEVGSHVCEQTVYNNFKKIVCKMGLPEVRFHDLRHTYATLALQNGVDVKTVSSTLGHATVAFTLDKYGHVSDAMMSDSADKMHRYIQSL